MNKNNGVYKLERPCIFFIPSQIYKALISGPDRSVLFNIDLLLSKTSDMNVIDTMKNSLREVLALDDLVILYELNKQLNNRFNNRYSFIEEKITSVVDPVVDTMTIGRSENEHNRVNLSDYFTDEDVFELTFDTRPHVMFVSVSLSVVKFLGAENKTFIDTVATPILSKYSQQYGDDAILKHPYFSSLMNQ